MKAPLLFWTGLPTHDGTWVQEKKGKVCKKYYPQGGDFL